MAMQDLVTLPSASVLPGNMSLQATAVPTGMTVVQLSVNRGLINNPNLDIDWTMELSIDGGVTWLGWGGGGNHGQNAKGNALDPPLDPCFQQHGLLVITEDATGATRVGASDVPAGWSIAPGFEPTNPDRMLRGTVTINQVAVIAATLAVG
jgi:hypothetical protein